MTGTECGALVAPGTSLGLCLRPQYSGEYSIAAMRRHAALADELGYHSVWLAESWGQNIVPVLADLAGRTARIAVGTAILNVFSRTPSLLAMSAATMSELYPGRFVLGLGAGTRALVEDWHGMSFAKPVARLADALAVVKAASTGDKVDYTGPTVRVSGYRLRVPPHQPPAPVFLAVLGPRGLDLVARAGDGWLPYLLARSRLGGHVETLRAVAAGAGRPGPPTIAPLIVTCVDADPDLAREQARRHIASYLGAMGPHYRDFVSSNGYADEVENVTRAWAAGDRGRATASVLDTMVDDIAICGDPAACAEQIAAWRVAGADLPILHFPSATSAEGVQLAIEGLAPAARATAIVGNSGGGHGG